MKRVVYIDMDNVLVDFTSAFQYLDADTLKECDGRLDEIPGIFSLMKPMEGAIEAFHRIARHYDVYVLSTAPWENPSAWSDKLLWVKKYLGDGAYKRLILSHNKHLNAGDYLIDDRLANGADRFQGQHIHFGTDSCPDWDEVLTYLHLDIHPTCIHKDYSFEQNRTIRELLLQFDPIEVMTFDYDARWWNEYDNYIIPVLNVLSGDHKDFKEIEQYLGYLDQVHIHSKKYSEQQINEWGEKFRKAFIEVTSESDETGETLNG